MEEKYDFYDLGQRYAKETIEVIRKKAEEYGRNFGLKAKRDFELGIISLIPQYADFYYISNDDEMDISKLENATTDYGKDNLRNNSYFGEGHSGIGVQYDNVTGHYNDPEKSSGSR